MARESSLWNWLAKARFEFGDALQIQRIENSICAGTPDVEGFLSLPDHTRRTLTKLPTEGAFWLELKSEERPARPTTPIRFKLKGREAQIEFMRHRWELGGNAFWFLQVGSYAERRLFLIPGNDGKEIARGVTESELLALSCNCGFFEKRFSQVEILKRIIQCRSQPSLLHPSRLPN
jgi:hypothetical protein